MCVGPWIIYLYTAESKIEIHFRIRHSYCSLCLFKNLSRSTRRLSRLLVVVLRVRAAVRVRFKSSVPHTETQQRLRPRLVTVQIAGCCECLSNDSLSRHLLWLQLSGRCCASPTSRCLEWPDHLLLLIEHPSGSCMWIFNII